MQCHVRLGAPLGRQRSAPYHGTLRLGVGSRRPLSPPAQMPGARLLDDLVRQDQQGRRYRNPKGLGGLEVNDELELQGLFHGQVSWLRPFENLVHVGGGAPVPLPQTDAIGHKTARLRIHAPGVYGREPTLQRQGHNGVAVRLEYQGVRQEEEGPAPACCMAAKAPSMSSGRRTSSTCNATPKAWAATCVSRT